MQPILERIAHQLPNLVDRILASDLPAKLGIEVFLADARRLAGDDV